jgi:glycosyltransferase involved in cell wall biosynthesis
MPAPIVSVIVPARDAAATIARTLAAVAAQQLRDGEFEVIVVDDGSRDDTLALARGAPGPTRVISQTALGPAAARNRGVAAASGRMLAFCDADVFPTAGWLAAGVRALEEADLVQGHVLPDPEVALGPFDRSLWITAQVGLWETANLFVTREVFDAVGGFREWISPRRGKALAEDVWFGYRALRAGARPAFCAAALAHHAVFARAWPAYVAERARRRYFPAMASRMPELRSAFLYRRLFLDARSARFDLAAAGVALALWRSTPLPLLATGPYIRAVRERRPAAVRCADVLADVVGFGALVAGSARYRAPVL